MKYLLILGLIVCNSAYSQTSDTIYNKIKSINFYNYTNKPVDSFLAVIPQGYSRIKLYGHSASNKVRYLAIQYPGGSHIVIKVKKYIHMNPIDANRVWDLNLYRKEQLHYVQLTHWDFAGESAVGD